MKLEWAIDIVPQCKTAGVACFVKQLGGHPNKRENIDSFPLELRIREFPTMTFIPNDA
jgi:protein gp37